MYADAITTLGGERVVRISLAGALTLIDSDTAIAFAVEILEAVRRLTSHQPDAATTPAGGGSEPAAAQVMFTSNFA